VKLSPIFILTSGIAGLILTSTWFILRRLNKEILWQRWHTWLAIALLFGSSYLIDAHAYRALILVIGMVMVFEFCSLMKFLDSITALVMMVIWQHYFDVFLGFSPASIDLVVLGLAIMVSLFQFKASKPAATPITFFGIILLGIVWPLLVLQPEKSLALLLAAACFDVASFTGGTLLGKRGALGLKIFPKTSPNKTLAGLLAGVMAVAILLLAFGKLNLGSLLLLVVGAVIGDYLESKAKRSSGVKDAASWLPGFGGLLDRFDSLILLAPLAVIIF